MNIFVNEESNNRGFLLQENNLTYTIYTFMNSFLELKTILCKPHQKVNPIWRRHNHSIYWLIIITLLVIVFNYAPHVKCFVNIISCTGTRTTSISSSFVVRVYTGGEYPTAFVYKKQIPCVETFNIVFVDNKLL